MGSEGVRQPEFGGELGPVSARAENPQRHLEPRAGDRDDPLAGFGAPEVGLQFEHVAGELVGVGAHVAAHRVGGGLVGARRAAKPEVDPSGEQRLKRPELLSNLKRRMVG